MGSYLSLTLSPQLIVANLFMKDHEEKALQFDLYTNKYQTNKYRTYG